MYNINYLVDELRLNGVLGRKECDKVRVYTMFRSDDTLLLRALGHFHWSDVWFLIKRTSRQCFRVTVMYEFVLGSIRGNCFDDSFVSYRLTADFIKKFLN